MMSGTPVSDGVLPVAVSSRYVVDPGSGVDVVLTAIRLRSDPFARQTATVTIPNWDEWAPTDVFTVGPNIDQINSRWTLERSTAIVVGPVS